MTVTQIVLWWIALWAGGLTVGLGVGNGVMRFYDVKPIGMTVALLAALGINFAATCAFFLTVL